MMLGRQAKQKLAQTLDLKGEQTMRFFNLDLHIGVIGDIKGIFAELGHEVVDWTLSAHAWVLGRERDKTEIIDHTNWREINQEMCDAFYNRYRAELEDYDGFIVTHTPCFAMLFEKWQKPIIVVASTRYEHPFTDRPDQWNNFNLFLKNGIDSGLIIAVANNKYDGAYAELFTDRKWKVIPSLCAYTGMKYQPQSDKILYWSKYKEKFRNKSIVDKDNLKPGKIQKIMNRLPFVNKKNGFGWSDISSYKAIVHIPYNVSVMSIFEQYTANIPLLFPSESYLQSLYFENRGRGVLSEISFNQVLGIAPGSTLRTGNDDPNQFDSQEILEKWIKYSDFYDESNLKHIVYFNSLEEVEALTQDFDAEAVSQQMLMHNVKRRAQIYDAWRVIIANVENILSQKVMGNFKLAKS